MIRRCFTPLLAMVALALTGCQTPNHGRESPRQTEELAAVRQRLDEIIDAAVNKDFKRLESYHLYEPTFTKFGTEGPRLDAESARKGEHDGLSAAAGLVMQMNDLKIDLFENTAIATFILNYRFAAAGTPVEKAARSTLILVKVDGSWKITHEHLSPR